MRRNPAWATALRTRSEKMSQTGRKVMSGAVDNHRHPSCLWVHPSQSLRGFFQGELIVCMWLLSDDTALNHTGKHELNLPAVGCWSKLWELITVDYEILYMWRELCKAVCGPTGSCMKSDVKWCWRKRRRSRRRRMRKNKGIKRKISVLLGLSWISPLWVTMLQRSNVKSVSHCLKEERNHEGRRRDDGDGLLPLSQPIHCYHNALTWQMQCNCRQW